MSSYSITIVTPLGKMFEGPCASLVAPGHEGLFGVLAKHAPMVIRLVKGIIQLKQEGKDHFFTLNSGILEVNEKGEVLILADHAVPSQNLEEAKKKIQEIRNVD